MNSNFCKNEILAGARIKSADADEIFGFASDEIKSTHPPSRRISPNEVGFHRLRRFHPPARVDLVENDRFLSESVVFCLWATKKIFSAVLCMNSNSCKNEILAGARMKSADADEIFGFASDEIKSTHPPSRRISPNKVGFHRCRRFHPPARVDLVENDRFLSESVVFWRRV